MAEYISKAEVMDIYKNTKSIFNMGMYLMELPTIDIVHCSECKYQGIIHNHEYCKLLGGMSRRGQGNWFCADGERKE